MNDYAKCQNKSCQLRTSCDRWEEIPSHSPSQNYVLHPEDDRMECIDYARKDVK